MSRSGNGPRSPCTVEIHTTFGHGVSNIVDAGHLPIYYD